MRACLINTVYTLKSIVISTKIPVGRQVKDIHENSMPKGKHININSIPCIVSIYEKRAWIEQCKVVLYCIYERIKKKQQNQPICWFSKSSRWLVKKQIVYKFYSCWWYLPFLLNRSCTENKYLSIIVFVLLKRSVYRISILHWTWNVCILYDHTHTRTDKTARLTFRFFFYINHRITANVSLINWLPLGKCVTWEFSRCETINQQTPTYMCIVYTARWILN